MEQVETKVDVVAVIRRHAESHRALADSDAYSAQEAPRLEAAMTAIAELIEAGSVAHMALIGYLPAHRNAVIDAAIAKVSAALACVGGGK